MKKKNNLILKKMNGNMKFRMMWVLAFLLAAPWAMAQKDIPPYGFAGEDFSVMLPSSTGIDGSFLITLGLKEDVYDGDDSYYEWHLEDAPGGFNFSEEVVFPAQHNGGNIHRHSIQARVLDEGDYEFSLTRLSKYGYQKECVIVTVRVFPKIVSATPKKHCYDFDDVVSIEDFDIVTEPQGPEYEKLISIKDPNVLRNYSPNLLHGTSIPVDVHFLCKSLRNTVRESDYVGRITLENHLKLTLDIDIISTIKKNCGKKEAISDADLKKAEKFFIGFNQLNKLSPKVAEALNNYFSGKLPIKPVVGLTVSNYLETQCCEEEWGLYFVLGMLTGELGVHFDYKIPIPPLGIYIPVYVKAVAQLNFEPFYVSLYPFRKCGHGPEKLELKFNIDVGAGAGVGIGEASGIDVTMIAGGGVPYYFYFESDKENCWGKPDWYLDLQVTVRTPTIDLPFRISLLKSK